MPYRSEHLARLVQDDHTSAVVDLEERTAASAVGDSESVFAELIRRTLAAWTRAFGGPDKPAAPGDVLRRILAAARAAVRRILDGLIPRAGKALEDSLDEAVTLGLAQGGEFLRAATGRRRRTPRRPRLAQAVRDEADRIGQIIVERRDRALHLLQTERVSRWSHLLAGLSAGHATLSVIRSHITWVVNTAVNVGLQAVARGAAKVRLWVSEADACVRCLAYIGLTSKVGEPFPGGLSWDPRQRRARADGVGGPPLHPNCRCRAVPWSDSWTADGVPFPLALQREAHRSIAYGRGRPTESRAARVRAARELLATERDLLPAVQARVRDALRTGRFAPAT